MSSVVDAGEFVGRGQPGEKLALAHRDAVRPHQHCEEHQQQAVSDPDLNAAVLPIAQGGGLVNAHDDVKGKPFGLGHAKDAFEPVTRRCCGHGETWNPRGERLLQCRISAALAHRLWQWWNTRNQNARGVDDRQAVIAGHGE